MIWDASVSELNESVLFPIEHTGMRGTTMKLAINPNPKFKSKEYGNTVFTNFTPHCHVWTLLVWPSDKVEHRLWPVLLVLRSYVRFNRIVGVIATNLFPLCKNVFWLNRRLVSTYCKTHTCMLALSLVCLCLCLNFTQTEERHTLCWA